MSILTTAHKNLIVKDVIFVVLIVTKNVENVISVIKFVMILKKVLV